MVVIAVMVVGHGESWGRAGRWLLLGQRAQEVLRLFEVIASPILVFAPSGELVHSLWPHAPRAQDQAPVPQRAHVQQAACASAAAWSRAIGDPKYLEQASAQGGIRLPDNSLVLIGPIAPLKVVLEGKTHYLENRTALLAANMWLTQQSAQCRRSVHAPPSGESLGGADDLSAPDLLADDLSSASAAAELTANAWEPMPEEEAPEVVSAVEQELSQLLGLKIQVEPEGRALGAGGGASAAHGAQLAAPAPQPRASLCSVLSRNFDLSSIVAAQGTAYNPFNGNFSADVVAPEDEDAFIAALHLGKISTVHHHNQLRNEVLMQEAVREGNLAKLRWANSLPTKGKAGILGLTPLRSWQNHAHISNVLASRAAIDAGIAPEEAYVLSDKLFLVVEQLTDPLLAKHMRFVIWRTFTEQVKQHREELAARQQTVAALSADTQTEPVLVLKARYLMAQRLMEPLSLAQIAAELGCTPEHLARCFKRYHHQTVHEYLVNERIKLAKELLLESNQKIGDIAQLLQFASSSHFGAAFKAREHLSPLKWRQLHAKIYEG